MESFISLLKKSVKRITTIYVKLNNLRKLGAVTLTDN